MKGLRRVFYSHSTLLAFALISIVTLAGMSLSTNTVSANHPVLVEGNCGSPIPSDPPFAVAAGTCGDYDGDTRIGTAEDTDGADRIFGTIGAALGPGTGAAAGTGANFNGKILIVTSGRFAETAGVSSTLFIGNSGIEVGEGTATPGNVTIEAAPGVHADINAVLAGDPAGGNTARQASTGIMINYTAAGTRVTLRNLTIRNFAQGVVAAGNASVTIDNCRFENNLNYAILAQGNSRVTTFKTRIEGTGFRIGAAGTPTPGTAIRFQDTAAGSIYHGQITGNLGQAIVNGGTGTVTYYEVFVGMNNVNALPPGAGIVTRETAP